MLMALTSATLSAYTFEVDGIYYWFLNSNEVMVTRNPDAIDEDGLYSGDIIIPETILYNGNTYSVTQIGDYAFYGSSGMTSIYIPNSITSIGRQAFWGCTGLTSINIPNSVTYIGSAAFNECSGLISVNLPNSFTHIYEDMFYSCSSLTSIIIPDSVTHIHYLAFAGCI